MDVDTIPVENLARWQASEMGARSYLTVAQNLAVARALEQLNLDIEGDRCVGYVGWVRLTLEQLRDVVRAGRVTFEIGDNTPGGAVCFLAEQMSQAPGVMQRRMRFLSTLPGVEYLAGWRNGRLRLHRVRVGR